MTWRGIYLKASGSNPEYEFVEPYTASVIFFLITASTGILLRGLTKFVVPRKFQEYLLDFITTMEACAYFFENNFVFKYYGSVWFGVCVMIQLFVCARTFQGSSENPVQALQALVQGQIGYIKAGIKIFIQSLAGLASYRLAKMIWSLDLISDHHERYYETSCVSDLQVTLILGFLIEMGASLSDCWLGMQTVTNMSLLNELIKNLNGSLMIIIGKFIDLDNIILISGLSSTGMYFNPAMALGHMLGCQGTKAWEHFIVYWFGPFLGGVAALYMDKGMHIDVKLATETKKKQQ
ncbi:hypothetical protein LOTGIDRAFT_137826 [Lottia gigantea]|uniref:Aquaporin n=1 Tax=Lottia gigantea TaxID=225164 RepID=V4CLK0_LOTGI|nr:hypothetical protein LOTGIDRAFT_137826 [Lottia gigantea]ESP03185.1 hypothetical protein LOTGIDRAFT_137826 [Lottia gigantea]